MRTLKTLAPLGLNVECALTFCLLNMCFCAAILGWTIFGLELWTRLWFYIHCFFVWHLWSQCLHHLKAIRSISDENRLIGLCVIWTLWSKFIVLTLYMFYLFYLFVKLFLLLSIDIINFIVCCCWRCFCLFVFLIHFIVVVPDLPYILFFCRLSVLYGLCCDC